MALSDEYILDVTLEPYFVNKDTGLPLANGKVYFYDDDNRNSPKPVYQLAGSPPNYNYAIMPNPIELSSVGTIQDADENNVAIYYKPYDDDGNVQLYYIVVTDEDDNVQFTREAWPNVTAGNDPTKGDDSFQNLLSNPQFADVNFDHDLGMTIAYSGGSGTKTFEFAPGWSIQLDYTGSGSTLIERESVSGFANLPTDPSYLLKISPGANLAGIRLVQRLYNDSGLFSGGFLAATATLGNATSLTVLYAPSVVGPSGPTTIYSKSNNTGNFAELTASAAIPGSSNTDAGDNAFVDIIFVLSTSNVSRLTSLQLSYSVNDPGETVRYAQVPVNRQRDMLSHIYSYDAMAKPIPSYLVGWDFAYNPAQLGEILGPFADGPQTSRYVWDQTIIFQESNNGYSVERDPSGCLKIISEVNASQFALVQYIERTQARDLLSGEMSLFISARTSVPTGVRAVASIWWTDEAVLPDLNSPVFDSIVADLDSIGYPSSRNGTWTEVENQQVQFCEFRVEPGPNFTEMRFENFSIDNLSEAETATYMAVVIGFAPIDDNLDVDIQAIALQKGSVATYPAPKSPDEHLRECQRYYEKSFLTDDPDDLENRLVTAQSACENRAGVFYFRQNGFSINFNVDKYDEPNLTVYSPDGGAANNVRAFVWGFGAIGNANADKAITYWSNDIGTKTAVFRPTGAANDGPSIATVEAGAVGQCWIELHYLADARLGII
jgi:hypothetical protein